MLLLHSVYLISLADKWTPRLRAYIHTCLLAQFRHLSTSIRLHLSSNKLLPRGPAHTPVLPWRHLSAWVLQSRILDTAVMDSQAPKGRVSGCSSSWGFLEASDSRCDDDTGTREEIDFRERWGSLGWLPSPKQSDNWLLMFVLLSSGVECAPSSSAV